MTKYVWTRMEEFDLPRENGRLQRSYIVYGKYTAAGNKPKFNPFITDYKKVYCEWTNHVELKEHIKRLGNPKRFIRVDGFIEDWVVKALTRFGNCLIGKSFPHGREIYLAELAKLGFFVKVRKSEKDYILEVIK